MPAIYDSGVEAKDEKEKRMVIIARSGANSGG
jgi:hypothetical protein